MNINVTSPKATLWVSHLGAVPMILNRSLGPTVAVCHNTGEVVGKVLGVTYDSKAQVFQADTVLEPGFENCIIDGSQLVSELIRSTRRSKIVVKQIICHVYRE